MVQNYKTHTNKPRGRHAEMFHNCKHTVTHTKKKRNNQKEEEVWNEKKNWKRKKIASTRANPGK